MEQLKRAETFLRPNPSGLTSLSRGLTLVELSVTLALVSIIATAGTLLMSSVINEYQFRNEVVDINGVLRRTMTECLARGQTGRLQIVDNQLIGSISDDFGALTELERVTLENTKFGRVGSLPTPLLAETGADASTWADDSVVVTATGNVLISGAIFMTDGDRDAAIEVLTGGIVSTYHVAVDGGTKWTR